MSKKAKIRENNPERADDPYVSELAEQFDQVHDLKTLYDTAGGERLVELLIKDVVRSVRRLQSNYMEYTHPQFIAECAALNANLNLARALTGAKANKEHLEEMIKDALTTEE